jgi:AcrR family transcriptional regulator
MAAVVKGNRMSELKGQAQRGAKTRAAIVDAALDVFALRGFRGSALADVADKVGLTPAGILYHFGSKEALLVAVIAERDHRAGGLLADMPADMGLDALRDVVRFAELSEQEPGLTALHTVLQVESFEPDTPAHQYFHDRSVFVRAWVEHILVAAQRKGEVRAEIDCKAKAREFIAFLEGAAVLWLIDPTVSLVELYQGFVDSFIEVIS